MAKKALSVLSIFFAFLFVTVFPSAAFASSAITVVYKYESKIMSETVVEVGTEIEAPYSDISVEEGYKIVWYIGDEEITFPFTVENEVATGGSIIFEGKKVKEEVKPSGDEGNTEKPDDGSGEQTGDAPSGDDGDDTGNHPSGGTETGDGNGDNESNINPEDMVESLVCDHAEISVEGSMEPDTLVEITVYSFEEGYALDYVLVSCGEKQVVTERNGNVISFIMPDGKISIAVIFKEGVSETPKKTSAFGTKEIIAVSVAGAILVVGGITIIVKTKRQGIRVTKEKEKK